MVETLSKNQTSSAEIVGALRGCEDESHPTLTELVHRATHEFHARWGRSAFKKLLASLAEDPARLPEFECLIVLGLAWPRLLTKHRISLSQEGRRLAVLFEHAGDRDRALALLELLSARLPEDRHVERDLAAMLRKTGKAGRLVERYLQRAEEAAHEGAPMDAIPWLQEVLLVDRSRRDVARMIRDLRYQEAERIGRRKKIVRRVLTTILLLAALGGAGWREWELQRRFSAIPAVDEDQIGALNARIAAIDALLVGNPLWAGALPASRERARLKVQVSRVNKKLEEQARVAASQAELASALADSALERGRLAVERRDFPVALAELRTALEYGAPDWDQRDRITRDIEALEKLIEETQGR